MKDFASKKFKIHRAVGEGFEDFSLKGQWWISRKTNSFFEYLDLEGKIIPFAQWYKTRAEARKSLQFFNSISN